MTDDEPIELHHLVAALLLARVGDGTVYWRFTPDDLERASRRTVRATRTYDGGVVVEMTAKGTGR